LGNFQRILSGNSQRILSGNSQRILSGNSQRILSGNSQRILSGNSQRILRDPLGQRFSLRQGRKNQILSVASVVPVQSYGSLALPVIFSSSSQSYLKKRQAQWHKEEEEERKRQEQLRLAPPGFSLMSEAERKETLDNLKKRELVVLIGLQFIV
jgi:hypothetical protein